MRFGSVCSGMEAASMAWHPLGWTTAFVAEIDPPACAVLAARLPGVPNLGDLTQWRNWVQDHPELLASIDVLIGGTPCQGFSFAGLRGSLSDDRSNLALDFLELADAIDTLRRARGRPSLVIVWENVPGVYSTPDNAFGCFLGALVGADAPLVPGRRQKWTHAGVVAGPARRAAWRTLDAQFFGVAQRRARVFVVASAGAVCPAEVLLERASVRGNPAPRRDTRQGAAVDLETGADDDSPIPHTAKALKTLSGGVDREDGHTLIPVAFKASHYTREKDGAPSDLAPPLSADADRGDQDTLVLAFGGNSSDPLDVAAALQGRCGGKNDFESETFIAFDTTQLTNPNNRSNPQPGEPCHTLSNNQHPPAIAFSCKDHGQDASEDMTPTLRAMGFTDSHANGGGQLAVAFALRGRDEGNVPEVHEDGAIASALRAESGGSTRDLVAFADVADPLVTKEGETYTQEGSGNFRVRNVITDTIQWAVRRLTPRECERLQGAPDDWTQTQYRGRPMADANRYKMCGNSMAVPVIRWLGERIEQARAE